MITIPFIICNDILVRAREDGLSQNDIKNKLNFPDEIYHRESGFISVDKYLRLIDAAERLDINLIKNYSNKKMIDGALQIMPTTFATVLNSPSLFKAIEYYINRSNYIEQLKFKMTINSESEISIYTHINNPLLQNSTYSTMGFFLIIRDLINYYTPDSNTNTRIELIGGKNTFFEKKMIQNIDVDCLIKCENNKITINSKHLHDPYYNFNSALFELTHKQSYEQGFTNLKESPELRLQAIIKNFYSKNIENNDIDIKHVAKILGLPSWTLQRKLISEGKSFSNILQKTKFDMACFYLKEKDTPLEIISSTLGFSSQSAFSRFFKEVAGITPLKYRKTN